jgi:diguanylate cyclase (GGDEF)-like protein
MGIQQWMFGKVDRERMIDMDARLRPTRRKTLAVLGAGLIACAPWAGWWTIAPIAAAALAYWLSERLITRFEHPGFLFFTTWVAVEGIIASSVALTGDLRYVTVYLLAVPVMTLNARFAVRGIIVGTVIAALLMATVLLAADPGAIGREPPLLVTPLMLVVACAMLSTPLMRSDIEHRGECVIDDLTGLLNRKAFVNRADEVVQQSEVTGDPVGLIVGDVDHFKQVNDEAGHAAGDLALVGIADRLRHQLRAFDAVFRVGGEEFVILLPGSDIGEATAIAEALRAAVNDTPLEDGWPISMSFGVSASRKGEPFDYRAALADADAAMYSAKRQGRNRVCIAECDDTSQITASRRALGVPAAA